MKGKIIVLTLVLTFLAACAAPQPRQEVTTLSTTIPCDQNNCGKHPS